MSFCNSFSRLLSRRGSSFSSKFTRSFEFPINFFQVFNPAALPRVVLLFDVLHPSVHADDDLTAAGLAHFRKVCSCNTSAAAYATPVAVVAPMPAVVAAVRPSFHAVVAAVRPSLYVFHLAKL